MIQYLLNLLCVHVGVALVISKEVCSRARCVGVPMA